MVNVLRLNDVVLLHRLDRELFTRVLLQPPDLHIAERTYTLGQPEYSLWVPSPRESPKTHSSGLMLLKTSFFDDFSIFYLQIKQMIPDCLKYLATENEPTLNKFQELLDKPFAADYKGDFGQFKFFIQRLKNDREEVANQKIAILECLA